MNLKTLNLKDLESAEYNPRNITDEALAGLGKSIEKFGYLEPLVVNVRDGKKRIISGHQRLKVLLAQGEKKAKCVIVDFDDGTEKAANIALNSETISGDWNLDGLETILEELKFEFPEFEEINLDGLAESLDIDLAGGFEDSESEEKDADEVPEIEEKPVIKSGDLIELEEHRLLCGDSTKADDVKRLMGGEKADMIFTDPPYGIKRDKGFEGFEGFGGFGKPIARRQYKSDEWDKERPPRDCFDYILTMGNHAIFFGGNFFADILPQSKHWLVWDKKNTMPTFGDCELAWTNIDRTSVKLYEFEYNGLIGKEKERFHPTQKPVGLFEAIFKDYVFQACLDPFLGSGSTLIACEKTKRKCFGIEIDAGYCQVIIQRWCDFTSNDKIKINGKEISWNEYKG